MKRFRILCIDDEEDFLLAVKIELAATFEIETAKTLDEGLKILSQKPIDLVLLDIELENASGISGIPRIKENFANVDVVMLSAKRDTRSIVDSIRAGASDFLTKPLDTEILKAVVEKVREKLSLSERYDALIEVQNKTNYNNGIIYCSDSMVRLLSQAEQLKGYQANVLIVGETGTGKELLARYLHRLEGQNARPFVAINCAAIPASLMETELFGAEPGAYTGALRRRLGRFELADGGDIFLDEVGSLKPDMQAKILRVLQEGEFCRVGGNDTIKANFRVIAATNEPLEEKVPNGSFRMDLYHRLRVIELTMPALRDRIEDIPALVEHFLKKFSKNGHKKTFSASAMARIMAYRWPGNVRELANVVQSLAILAKGDIIDDSAFPKWVLNGCGMIDANPEVPMIESGVGKLKEYVSRAERHYIEFALRSCDGDKSRTARKLDIGRTTLYWKMKELGLI